MLASLGIMDYSILLGIENRVTVCDDEGIEETSTDHKDYLKLNRESPELSVFKRHIFKSPDGN